MPTTETRPAFKATHRLVDASLADEKQEYGQSLMLHNGGYYDRSAWFKQASPINEKELEGWGYVIKPITKKGTK
jgi:hypothetical protein